MNIQIPLNAHINTKDEFIIHDIDSSDKDALQKKNTLLFQSTLSPMYTKSAEHTVYTTTGKLIPVSNSAIGEDQVYNTRAIRKVIDFSKLEGKVTGVYPSGTDYIITRRTDNYLSADIYDSKGDFKRNIHTTQVANNAVSWDSGIVNNYIVFYVFDGDASNTWFFDFTGTLQHTLAVGDDTGKDLYLYYKNNTYFIGFDDKDVRKRYTYILDNVLDYRGKIHGFGCIGSNGLLTGEPIPIHGNENPLTNIFIYWLENGVGALDNATENSVTAASWINSNQVLKEDAGYNFESGNVYNWGTLPDGQTPVNHLPNSCHYIGGYNLNKPISGSYAYEALKIDYGISYELKTPDGKDIKSVFGVQTNAEQVGIIPQVDFSDGWGNLEWNSSTNTPTIQDGCNPFPYRYLIFNRASSRGIYWDYGPGWVRSYYREAIFRAYNGKRAFCQTNPAAIISYGLSPVGLLSANDNRALKRIEFLSPIVQDNHILPQDHYEIVPTEESPFAYSKYYYLAYLQPRTYYRFHTFNPTIFEKGTIWTEMIGADNLPNHSVLNAIPFNVDAGNGITHQYYRGNYMSSAINGTLLTSASVRTETPSIVYKKDNVIYVIDNGLLIEIPSEANVTLTKIADYIYKTNTVTGNNLLIDNGAKQYFERGFISYNGEEIIYPNDLQFPLGSDNEDTDGNSTYYSATGYNGNLTDATKRGVSYLLPAFQLPLLVDSASVEDFTFQLCSNKKELTKPLLLNQFTFKDDAVDHYYNHSLNSTNVEYQTGHKMQSSNNNANEALYGVKTYDIDKEKQTWWITSEIQIFPLGIASPLTGINYIASNIDLPDDYSVRLYRTNNVTFPVYNPNTGVYKSSNIFTIYGYNYSFDGQSIYYLGSGNDTSQSNFTCYALGMRFLANSGTEAYFYSPFEKRLYIFTGSVTLQVADSLAREADIIDSVFSSCEQILYLMTADGKIIAKSQEDMCVIETVDPSVYHFETTETGFILVGNNSYKTYRLYKTNETEYLPLEYETEYIGKNNSLFKISSVEVTYFKGNGNTVSGNFNFECMNDALKYNEVIPFTVSKKDWEKSQLVKVKVTPKNNVLKAFKLGIKSDDYIHIANVNIAIEEVSTNTNAPIRK